MDTNDLEALKLLLGKHDNAELEQALLDLSLKEGGLPQVFVQAQYNLARVTLREVLLACYQQGLYAESMTFLMTRAWLEAGKAYYPQLGDEAIAVWQTYPVEVNHLVLEATRKLMYTLGGDEFDISQLPVMGPLYTEWTPHIQHRPEEADDAHQMHLLEQFYAIFQRTFQQLQQLPHMVLDVRSYHQLMTELLLQLYVFSYHKTPKMYYQLASVWDDVYPAAGQSLLRLLALSYTEPERFNLDAREQWIELL